MPMRGNEYTVPEEIPTNVECPACGSLLFLMNYEMEIPHEGYIMIQTYTCHSCLYKKSNVFSSEPGRHIKINLRIDSSSLLNTMVYRSPAAFVYIPEFGAEISPGEKSSGYVTTVEGILRRLDEYIDMMPYEDEEEFNRVKALLHEAEEGNIPFTLVIDDETGRSSVSSDRATVEYIQ